MAFGDLFHPNFYFYAVINLHVKLIKLVHLPIVANMSNNSSFSDKAASLQCHYWYIYNISSAKPSLKELSRFNILLV